MITLALPKSTHFKDLKLILEVLKYFKLFKNLNPQIVYF